MTALLIILCIILLIVVILQVGKVSEIAGRIRGEEEVQKGTNYWQSRLLLVFMVGFLVTVVLATYYYKNYMLGYGPNAAASAHGARIDAMFNRTLIIVSIVFFATHILLFWFSFRWRDKGKKGQMAKWIPENNTLELLWTIVPALVLTTMVIFGLNAWNDIMADVDDTEDVIQIEATGMQFAWMIRYPGPDGEFGRRNFRNISALNPLGQIWTDSAGLDDFMSTTIVLPVDKEVRVKIGSRDVIHSFFLPQFRVKMDAVPGMPTYFVFTPTRTTKEYRQDLKKYEEYWAPADPEDPSGPKRWEAFNYELACAELCGEGHYSMRMIVKVVSQEEYEDWLLMQSPYYQSTIKGSDIDPYKVVEPEAPAGMGIDSSSIDSLTVPAEGIETDSL